VKLLLITSLLFLGGCKFNWEADPYEMAPTFMVNADGHMILYSSPEIVEYSCFSAENLADLRVEIDRINKKNDDFLESYD